MAGRRDALHGREIGDAGDQCAPAQAIFDDCLFGCYGIDIRGQIPRRHALSLNVTRNNDSTGM
jgi:hypothetical protein